jgi:hypothetical protein
MIEDPIKTAEKEISKFVPNYLSYGEQSQVPTIFHPQMSSILTLPPVHFPKIQK